MKKTTTIGQKLYTLRESHNMTQDVLAEQLHVSRQTISNWENDKAKIDIGKATQICQLFEISIDQFVNGEGTTPEHRQQTDATAGLQRNSAIKWVVLSVVLVILVVSIVLCALSSNDNVSSTILLTPMALYGIMAVVLAITAVLVVVSIFKKK